MITNEVVEAQQRDTRGKNEARRVRAQGLIPAIVYGAGKEPVSVSVDPKKISRILNSESGHNTIFDVQVNGGSEKVMVVEWQNDPIKGNLLHIDLKRIAMDKPIQVHVPILLTGIAAGVKQQGGILDQVLRELEIECLPADIPSHIDADVSELVFGQVLRVSDLPHSDKITFLTEEDMTVAHITAVKEEAAPVAAEVTAEAAPAEPELIKKGKQEEEAAPAEPKK